MRSLAERVVRIDRARFLSTRQLCQRYGVDSAALRALRATPGFPPAIRVLNDRESYFERWALIPWEIGRVRLKLPRESAPMGIDF